MTKKTCNKQRNKCVSLLRKTKRAYYFNLNIKDIVDNKKFWEIAKSFFSDKSNIFRYINLGKQIHYKKYNQKLHHIEYYDEK